jgi:L-2-hydroxyglutarate oxidase LhgO
MLALQGEAEAHGVSFAFRSTCTGVRLLEGGFIVTVKSEAGEGADIAVRHLVNAAGHGAHRVARSVAGLPPQVLPPQHFAKGSYCTVSGPSPFRHLVYPVPVSGALGIHATVDTAGAVRFGPDISWVEELDYSMPDGLPPRFSAAISGYWPGVSARQLQPSYCGVRPKIHGPDTGFADFMIQHQGAHGIAGLVNLFGIESPGLTASLAIGNRVAGLIAGRGASGLNDCALVNDD